MGKNACSALVRVKLHSRIIDSGTLEDMRRRNIEPIKRRRRSVAAPAVKPTAVKKVVTDFPVPLFQAAERAAHELSMNRSCFIRTAIESFLRNREKEKLEQAIAESFRANAELDRQLVDEFKYADAGELPNL